MTASQAIDLTALIWAVAMAATLSIAVPQAILLVRMRKRRDRLSPFRIMSATLFGSLGVAMARNVAVWTDLAFFDQQYLGPIARRWPLDLVLALLVMAACIYAAGLYQRVQREVS